MVAESPRTLVLVGRLDAREMRSLATYCRRLYDAGLTELHLDIGGVRHCERAGLDGLLELIGGSARVRVSVDGARWSQFTALLKGASGAELEGLCDSVWTLLPPVARRA